MIIREPAEKRSPMADGRLDVRIDPCAHEELIRYRVTRRERRELAWTLQVLWATGMDSESARGLGIRRRQVGSVAFFVKALGRRQDDAPVVWIFFCLGMRDGKPMAVIIECQGMCVMRMRSCREHAMRAAALRAGRVQRFFD